MASVTLQLHRLDELAAILPEGRLFEPNRALGDLYAERRALVPDLFGRDRSWAAKH